MEEGCGVGEIIKGCLTLLSGKLICPWRLFEVALLCRLRATPFSGSTSGAAGTVMYEKSQDHGSLQLPKKPRLEAF
jgi:hypothetical protein